MCVVCVCVCVVGVCVCGCVGVWVCGCVGVWVCGCVGVWVCGGVGVWVCGGEGAWVGEWVGGCVCVCVFKRTMAKQGPRRSSNHRTSRTWKQIGLPRSNGSTNLKWGPLVSLLKATGSH